MLQDVPGQRTETNSKDHVISAAAIGAETRQVGVDKKTKDVLNSIFVAHLHQIGALRAFSRTPAEKGPV